MLESLEVLSKIKAMSKEDRINPYYYKSHPTGIECITIKRHHNSDIADAIKYLWRQGLKVEAGLDVKDKQAEDLRKAIWYINDHIQHYVGKGHRVSHPSGVKVNEIAEHYDPLIGSAISLIYLEGLGGFVNKTNCNAAIVLIETYLEKIERKSL